MAQISIPQWARVGVDIVQEEFQKNLRTFWDQFTSDEPDNGQLFLRLATFMSLGVAGTTNELQGVNEGDFSSTYLKDYQYYKRSNSVLLSREALRRDQRLNKVFTAVPQHIQQSIVKAREYDSANLVNLATTITTPDGVAFASASHPLLNGNVDSNYVTGAPSIALLESGIQTMEVQCDQNGDPYVGAFGDWFLMCHPSYHMFWERITTAAGYPDTIATGRYNDPNPAGQKISRVISNPYLTAGPAAILLPVNRDMNPLFVSTQESTDVRVNEIPQVDGVQTLGVAIWASGAKDYRGTIYFPGS